MDVHGTKLDRTLPAWLRATGITVLVLALVGLFYGALYGGIPLMLERGRAAEWSWWHYALAVPALGVAYLLLEGVAAVVLAPFSWGGDDQPKWKRAAFRFFVFLAICLGVGFALSPWWLAKLGNANVI